MQIHIIGMSKSSLNLNGGKGRNLELDVLRMIHFITHLKKNNEVVQGYICIYDEKIQDRIENKWFKKYRFSNENEIIKIIRFSDYLDRLEIQKMIKEKLDNSLHKNSKADYSQQVTETLFKRVIESNYTGFTLIPKGNNELPSGISWDYYEIIEKSAILHNI